MKQKLEQQLTANQTRAINRLFVKRLKEIYLEKQELNPSFSLRAFAQKIGIDQSYLSKVLRGQKILTIKNMNQMALKLGFINELEPSVREAPSFKKECLFLDEIQFQSLANWKFFAVIELVKTKNFRFEYSWIEKRLGIPAEELRDIFAKLNDLNLIQINGNEVKIIQGKTSWVNEKMSSRARVQLQQIYLEKSKKALEEISIQDRDHSSVTLAIGRHRMAEFKQKITQMRRELIDYFQDESEKDEVYQLVISLFPLTQLQIPDETVVQSNSNEPIKEISDVLDQSAGDAIL